MVIEEIKQQLKPTRGVVLTVQKIRWGGGVMHKKLGREKRENTYSFLAICSNKHYYFLVKTYEQKLVILILRIVDVIFDIVR